MKIPMGHAGSLLTHYRRQGGPTAYETRTGRKYCGKVAAFGERVLARVKRANGSDKFEPGLWLGKTDRADFHMVATASVLKWARTIRRLPTPFDPEAVTYVKFWPWNSGFGQLGAKASSLVGKFPTAPLPPALAPAIGAEEKKLAKEEKAKKKEDEARARGDEARGEKRQAGADEESSKGGDDPDMSDYTPTQPDEEKDEGGLVITDDTLLQDLLDSSEVEKAPASPRRSPMDSPKRSGGEGDVEDEMPKKTVKSAPGKVLKTKASSEKDEPEPASIRMVVAGELLYDGDEGLEFPDQPPELPEAELAEIEDEATKEEIQRLIGMTVLLPPAKHDDLEDIPLLTTKLVMGWRWRENKWKRRARLVARDFAWCDPNRTDVFAPAGGHSLLRLVPAICQVKGRKMIAMDVKDAYLMCAQPRKVKVSLDKALAERLGLQQEWILGRILPGQREGAVEKEPE